MIPVDEFYEKPRSDQQQIVDDGHVVVDGETVDSIPSPDDRGTVHVFERPVTDIVVDTLKGGRYTAGELEPEFPIDKQELDDLFWWMKYRPMDLLVDHHGLLRVVDTEGAAYVYTIESIPFLPRCIDPTLSGYLLHANERFPFSRPQISTRQDHGAREEYREAAVDYWGLPIDEISTRVDSEGFTTSTLGPLPVVDEFPEANRVIGRFRSVDDSYRRKQHDVDKVKHSISFHKSRCRRNPSLAAFQAFGLYLFDVNEYATLENDTHLRELVERGAFVLYQCLYGNLWPGAATAWQPFQINILEDVDTRVRRVADIVEQQPTSNGQLADRWGFDNNKAVSELLRSELNQYATRNSDQFVCATESARRYISELEQKGTVELSKTPPRVPSKSRIDLEVSEQASEGNSGVDWSR